MYSYRQVKATPNRVAELWRRFWRRRELFAGGAFATVGEFVEVITSPDTVLYELGDNGGVIFFTDVIPEGTAMRVVEPRASAHVLLWDRDLYGLPGLATAVNLDAMNLWGLRRVLAEIPASNTLARRYCQRAGFKQIGVLRGRVRVGNRWRDAVVYDAMYDDLENARVEELNNGRHRRVRREVAVEGL